MILDFILSRICDKTLYVKLRNYCLLLSRVDSSKFTVLVIWCLSVSRRVFVLRGWRWSHQSATRCRTQMLVIFYINVFLQTFTFNFRYVLNFKKKTYIFDFRECVFKKKFFLILKLNETKTIQFFQIFVFIFPYFQNTHLGISSTQFVNNIGDVVIISLLRAKRMTMFFSSIVQCVSIWPFLFIRLNINHVFGWE